MGLLRLQLERHVRGEVSLFRLVVELEDLDEGVVFVAANGVAGEDLHQLSIGLILSDLDHGLPSRRAQLRMLVSSH
jgi:hypothetical protein